MPKRVELHQEKWPENLGSKMKPRTSRTSRTSRTKDAKDAKDPSKLAILWDINLQVDAHVARVQLPLPDTATV